MGNKKPALSEETFKDLSRQEAKARQEANAEAIGSLKKKLDSEDFAFPAETTAATQSPLRPSLTEVKEMASACFEFSKRILKKDSENVVLQSPAKVIEDNFKKLDSNRSLSASDVEDAKEKILTAVEQIFKDKKGKHDYENAFEVIRDMKAAHVSKLPGLTSELKGEMDSLVSHTSFKEVHAAPGWGTAPASKATGASQGKKPPAHHS